MHARSRTVNIHSCERLTNKTPPIMCQACDMDAPLHDDTAWHVIDFASTRRTDL